MIILVGTGHVFDLSSKIIQLVEEFSPDVICIELDKRRYYSLLSEDTTPKRVPLAYRILSRFQRRIAEWHGVRVGEEMITAIKIADEKNIPIELIDMDAEIIFKKLWKSLSPFEKMKLIFSGILGLVKSRSSIEREMINLENRVDDIMKEVEKSFPSLKKVLVDERDRYMAEKLKNLSTRFERIMAIVGDSHVTGIEKILSEKKIEVKTIRLKDLKNDVSFSFTVSYGPVA